MEPGTPWKPPWGFASGQQQLPSPCRAQHPSAGRRPLSHKMAAALGPASPRVPGRRHPGGALRLASPRRGAVRPRRPSALARSPPAPGAAPGSPRGIAPCASHRIGAGRGASPGRGGGDQRGSREYRGGPGEAEGPAVPAVPLLSPLFPAEGLREWGHSGVHSPHPSPAAPCARGRPCQVPLRRPRGKARRWFPFRACPYATRLL